MSSRFSLRRITRCNNCIMPSVFPASLKEVVLPFDEIYEIRFLFFGGTPLLTYHNSLFRGCNLFYIIRQSKKSTQSYQHYQQVFQHIYYPLFSNKNRNNSHLFPFPEWGFPSFENQQNSLRNMDSIVSPVIMRLKMQKQNTRERSAPFPGVF